MSPNNVDTESSRGDSRDQILLEAVHVNDVWTPPFEHRVNAANEMREPQMPFVREFDSYPAPSSLERSSPRLKVMAQTSTALTDFAISAAA